MRIWLVFACSLVGTTAHTQEYSPRDVPTEALVRSILDEVGGEGMRPPLIEVLSDREFSERFPNAGSGIARSCAVYLLGTIAIRDDGCAWESAGEVALAHELTHHVQFLSGTYWQEGTRECNAYRSGIEYARKRSWHNRERTLVYHYQQLGCP